jgi:hypothetical protein
MSKRVIFLLLLSTVILYSASHFYEPNVNAFKVEQMGVRM